MSYDPYYQQQQPPYQQQPYPQQQPPYPQQQPYPPPPPYPQDRHRDSTGTLIAIVRVVVGLATTVFLLHILFVLLEANQGNGFVSFVYMLAKALVLGLGDVFTPDEAKVGVVMNYGLAALVYAVVGHVIINALRRR